MKDTPMKVEACRTSNNQLYETTPLVKGNMSGMSNLAKFKAAQDLRIQTQDLPEKKTNSNILRRSGSSSSSGTLSVPNTSSFSPPSSPTINTSQSTCTTYNEGDPELLDGDEDECSGTPDTPIPPSSTGKKRRRRTANQIDRKYACSYPGCAKAYGSEGSLTQHQRLKHRVDLSNPSNQTGAFFLPLHRARHAATAAAATTHPLDRQGAPGLTKTVNIRPALEGRMMTPHAPFDVSVAAAAAAAVAVTVSASGPSVSAAASVPASVSAPVTIRAAAASLPMDQMLLTSVNALARPSLRARSNSMPISSSSRLITKVAQSPFSSRSRGSATTPRPQSTRRSRVNSSTPRARTTTAAMASARQTTKRRSKSESLAEISMGVVGSQPPQLHDHQPLMEGGNVPLSFPERGYSDTTTLASSVSPHSSFGVNLRALAGSQPFDWSSIDMHGPSRASSSDEAIDSDILCVLADCDEDGTGSDSRDTLGFVTSPDGFRPSVPFSAVEMDGMLSTDPFDGCHTSSSGLGMTPPVSAAVTHRGDPSLSPHGGPGPNAEEGSNTAFLRVAEDWQYLSTHLEKMTMLQEPESLLASSNNAVFPTANAMDPFSLEMVSEDDDETLNSVRATRGLYLPIYPQSLSRSLSNALAEEPTTYATNDLDTNSLYMDDDVDMTTFAALKADSKGMLRPLSPMYSFAKCAHPMYDRQLSLGSIGSVGSLGGIAAFGPDASLFSAVDGMDLGMDDVRI